MADIPAVRVVGRLGLTVGDGADPDEFPDITWCDSGTVRLTPLNTYTKVAGGSPVPWTAGHSSIDVPIDSDGFLTWQGAKYVWVLDMASDAVNPTIGSGKATHRVEFRNVKAQGVTVAFDSTTVRFSTDTAAPITADEAAAYGLPEDALVCDITLLTPVPAAGGTPIVRGVPGVSVQSLAVTDGNLAYELSDGTTGDAGELPVGPGGSDEGVAGYIADPESETATQLSAAIATRTVDKLDVTAAASTYDTITTAAQRAAANADHASAFGRIQKAMLGAAAGLFLSRSSNDYTFLVGLGSAHYAAFFLPRLAQSLNGVTYTLNNLNGCAIQIPMLSQDDTLGTFAGSGTWTTQPTTNPTDAGYIAKPLTVSSTASSGTLTVTTGTLVAGDVGRRVLLPGLGVSGADLQTTIATVNTGAGTFTVGTAPTITAAGVAATIFPTYRYNATAGGTATWVSPANAIALALGIVTAPNGGLAKVTISGATAGSVSANLLPTAQQVVDAGRYASAILVANGGTLDPTDRVLDAYAATISANQRRAIAEALTADTYTVTVTATGYTAIGGTAARTYVDRFAYALASTTPTTAGAEMFTAYDLSPGFASAWEYAIECKPSSGSTWTFIGQTAHQYEDQQSFTVMLDDGVTTPPTDGQTLAVRSAQITRTTKLYHPDSGASLASNPIATSTVVYRLDRQGLTVTPIVTFQMPTDIRTAYSMMPLVGKNGAGAKIDRALLEAIGDVVTLTASGNRFGFSRSAFAWGWDSTGKVGAAMYVPDFYGFTEGYMNTLDGSQIEDRVSPSTTKFYFPWVGVNHARSVPAGWAKTWTTRHMLAYLPDASVLAAA